MPKDLKKTKLYKKEIIGDMSWQRGHNSSPYCILSGNTSFNYRSWKSNKEFKDSGKFWPFAIGQFVNCGEKGKIIITSNVFFFLYHFNSLRNDKTVDLSKLKAFADDKTDVSQKLKFALGRVQNVMGKRRKCCYQHFLLFPQFLKKATL